MAQPELRQRGAAATELLLGAAVLLTRVPFLFAGYGTDPDAWRVAWTGRAIAASGVYQSSRAPGNPIPELAAAALSGLGPWALNGLTALFGAAAVVLFGRLLRRLGCRAWIWGALAFAFTPVIANNSVNAMDYLWALAFVLAGCLAALDGRALVAGVAIGLASGCRLTSLSMLVPLALLLAGPGVPGDRRARRLLVLASAGFATAAIAFAPVMARYGAGFLRAYEHGYPPPVYVFKNMTVEVWGVPGTIAIGIAALVAFRTAGRRGAEGGSESRRVELAALAGLGILLLQFLRLPHEPEYLIPAVPLALLLLARWVPARGFAWVAAAIVLSSFTLKVSETGKPDAVHPSALARTVHLGSRTLIVDPLVGPLMSEHLRRENGVRYVESVRRAAQALETPAVVVALEWLPALRVRIGGDREGRVEYVYLLDRASIDDYRSRGFAIFDLPGAESDTWTVHGYDLREAGSRPLAVDSDSRP